MPPVTLCHAGSQCSSLARCAAERPLIASQPRRRRAALCLLTRASSQDEHLAPTPPPFARNEEETVAELVSSPLLGRGVKAFDATAELAADVARLRAATPSTSASLRAEPGLGERLNDALVGVFFLVLFFGAWLLASVAEEQVLKTERLSSAWLSLWPVLIQPALGVLMLASIGSGAAAWVRQQREGQAKRAARDEVE